jgi:hypothetical protein
MPPASFSSATTSYDKLIAGEMPIASKKVTLLSGQNCLRGSVLGKKTAGAGVGAAVAGNAGDGTIGTVSAGVGAQPGVYRITCIEPAANGGQFAVEDPSGVTIGDAVVGTPFVGEVVFTIADGAADFGAGDQFTVTVAAGTGKYLLSASAAVDGSQEPDAILAEDCDASLADGEALVYTRGDFAESALVFGVGQTAATVRETLRKKGINLVAIQPA